MSKYKHILAQALENKLSWKEIKADISKFNVHDSLTGKKDTRAGQIFELFTKYYFLTSPVYKHNFKNIWMFNEIPQDVKDILNLGTQDYGVDLVLQDYENKYFVVQCKFKNDEYSRLNWTADKIANLFGVCDKADGYIVFSNASDLDLVSKTRRNNFTFYSINDLLEISSDNIAEMVCLLKGETFIKHKPYRPLRHQEDAINACVQAFKLFDRGQLILPCGAGKTLTSLWIKERLNCKKTLVLVPSLALLKQIKNEWARHRSASYHYICVCSEYDIDEIGDDTLVSHTYEIDIHVTTNPLQIKEFLECDFEEKIIFSTYHSLNAVAEAISKMEYQFDFVFCDEAHKTAGIGANKFSLIHDNSIIPSKRRLYSTATPRIVKESLKKKLAENFIYSYDMNDPDIYGLEFYRMTFKDAIEKDILVDYKILAVGVDDEEISKLVDERRLIEQNVSIDEVANNFALNKTMESNNATHALTFHSRVRLAEAFAKRHNSLFPNIKAFSVSGEQSTNTRKMILSQFEESELGVVSNARCLTEGVDIPAIDLVYFCDPKNSKIDIIQAVGRALRKKEGKQIGLIVVPIYHSKNADLEVSINNSSFRNLLMVIRSLCDQDERLQDEINILASNKGQRIGGKSNISATFLNSGKDFMLFESFEDDLKNALFNQIVEKSSNSWDLLFIKVTNFLAKYQRYPNSQDDPILYNWIAVQRNKYKSNNLKNEEVRKLKSIHFVWDQSDWKWNGMYNRLLEYAEKNEFAPDKNIDSELSAWYGTHIRQSKSNNYSEEKKLKIQAVKFKGPASQNKWIPLYNELAIFRNENPGKWPQSRTKTSTESEKSLSIFCQTIRKLYREGVLGDVWFNKMLVLGFNFEGRTDNWIENFNKYHQIIKETNSISISSLGSKGYSWVLNQKKMYDKGSLTSGQMMKIEQLNEGRVELWDDTFLKVKDFFDTTGQLPRRSTHKEYATWLNNQKTKYKQGQLDYTKTTALLLIGFNFEYAGNEAKEIRWREMFSYLSDFRNNNSNKWPTMNSEGLEKEIYIWCQGQRQTHANTSKNKPLSDWKIAALNSIGFHWSLKELNDQEWENNFLALRDFLKTNNLNDLSSTGKLYRWIYNQNISFTKGSYSNEKFERLSKIGVDIAGRIKNKENYGYEKWARGLSDISAFVKANGRYPRAGVIVEEKRMYISFANTKRSFNKNELSLKQLDLIRELGLSID